MRHTHQSGFNTRRSGVVLLVVIAMLALFAVTALAFVFYADAEAATSRIALQTQTGYQPEIDPESLLAYFLGQLIYPVNGEDWTKPNYNPYSALRGHELSRAVYGCTYTSYDFVNSRAVPYGTSALPFAGVGRLRYANAGAGGLEDYNMVNYTYYPKDGFIRDPEYYGARVNPQAPPALSSYRAGNAPYTYPDLNNLFLASVNADGEVLKPSFHTDPNWTTVTFDPTDKRFLGGDQKYYTLIPHPSYHDQFLKNLVDAPGAVIGLPHVKNLPFARGYRTGANTYDPNDSYWLDLGFPVVTAPNGKRFKAMFAPLVIDLDNRIHAWVTGNGNGAGGASASNQGFGPSEIALSRLMASTAEYQALFNRRYPTGLAVPPSPPNSWPDRDGPWYARLDFKAEAGLNRPSYSTDGSPPYPAGTSSPFPSYPPWWNNETTSNPLSGNYFIDQQKMHPGNMEALLRYKDKNVAAVTSELYRLLANTLKQPRATPAFANGYDDNQVRNLITLLSWSFDRPSGAPYINFDGSNGANAGLYTLNGPFPTLMRQGNPPPIPPTMPAFDPATAPGNEYGSDFQSTLVKRLRVNLNRLSSQADDYPAPDANGNMNGGQFTTVTQNRQKLAKDIYETLVLVTGATDPAKVLPAPPMVPPALNSPQYNATRYLAQLAVNIVDYIDRDDVITPFNWYGGTSGEWVFGTEIPRLVINEAYVQYDNDFDDFPGQGKGKAKGIGKGTGKGRASGYNLNCWVELHNPFNNTPGGETYPYDNGTARLRIDNMAVTNRMVHQLVLSRQDPALNNADNVKGDVAVGNQVVANWGTNPAGNAVDNVDPANGAFNIAPGGNAGFYVVGPRVTFGPGRDPNLPTTTLTAEMSWEQLPKQGPFNPTILLRRLANPYLDHDPNPANASYNPYVTVDYIENVPVADNREFDENVPIAPPIPGPTNGMSMSASTIRTQPYRATGLIAANNGNRPRHYFFQHNADNQGALPAFNTLIHPDRPVVNALELFHVSGQTPHRLTQKFMNPTPDSHYAPWLSQDAMIYRALDLLGVPSRLNGAFAGGREPGRININTLNDIDVWLALCDAVTANNFSTFTDVQPPMPPNDPNNIRNIWQNVVNSRTPNGAPSFQDRPFLGFASGHLQQTAGIGNQTVDILHNSTLLRTNDGTPSGQRILKLSTPNPYREWELLQKIHNNVTTTSNVFAVWVTVGFFEVDDSVTPPKLLKEVGREENRHTRHRMFAIVDRSELAITRLSAAQAIGQGSNVPATVQGEVFNTMIGQKVEIGPDPDPASPSYGKSELATITSMNPSVNAQGAQLFLETVTNNYSIRTPLVVRGNPGPLPRLLRSQITMNTGTGPAVDVPVIGTVSNKMVGTFIEVGDPTTSNILKLFVQQVNMIDANTATIRVSLAVALPAGTVISFRGSTNENLPAYLQYNPRHDRAVVPHYTVIE